MKTRALLFAMPLLAALALAWALWHEGGEPVAVPQPDPSQATEEPAAGAPAAAAPVATTTPGPEQVPAPMAPPEARETVQPKGWTAGIIRGDVQLAASVVDRIQGLQVTVAELKAVLDTQGNATRPWTRTQRVEMGKGTPTFEVREVPFSKYGYAVRIYSPGLNGSQQTVTITEEHPLEEGVRLSVTPGVPFSVLLRDQDANPVPAAPVKMAPIGDPPGRPVHDGTSDGFGSAVFADVLAGDYRIFVGPAHAPLMEPVEVTVHPAGMTFRNGQVLSQGTTVVVPRGVPVTVLVRDVGNYGVADARVRLQATDRVKLTVVEGTTDLAGRWSIQHLQPGIWQVDVIKDGYQRTSRQFTATEGTPVPDLEFRILRN
ncbi:MAG: hypothetical protein RL148_595 [Planctomycetota bacterium]|jgi:hypothetical protein